MASRRGQDESGQPLDRPGRDRPALQVRGLTVDFPAVRALDGVDFDAAPGEIHALMGENGAGKSTLIRVLAGLQRPGAGSIAVGGHEQAFRSPRDAERAGISVVHQEIDLVPTMSVADNICLGRQRSRWGFLGRRAMSRRAARALGRLGLALPVGRTVGELPIAVQQLVAIARALDIDARTLILDEPTSSLDTEETRRLFAILRAERERGLAIVFVTHFLDQVYEIADRITVLRNGARVGTWAAAALPRPALVEAMTGRAIGELPRIARAARQSGGATALEFEGLGRRRAIAPVTGRIGRGESLGIAGLLGSGRSELARLIFGADAPDSGSVRVGDRTLRPGSIRDAVAHGLAFTPEDRKAQGLIPDLSVRENIALALQARLGALRPIRRAQQRRLADHYIASLRIRTPDPGTPVRSLSGGNQQKVLLARWLATRPTVLILDEPTRGIDVGARAEIESLIADLRAQGLAIMLISAELDEIARTCDRVLVLRDRRAVGELAQDQVSESAILSMIAAGGPA